MQGGAIQGGAIQGRLGSGTEIAPQYAQHGPGFGAPPSPVPVPPAVGIPNSPSQRKRSGGSTKWVVVGLTGGVLVCVALVGLVGIGRCSSSGTEKGWGKSPSISQSSKTGSPQSALGAGNPDNGKSAEGCLIGETRYDYETKNPSNECEVCSTSNQSGWTVKPGAECTRPAGGKCNERGQCIMSSTLSAGTYHTCHLDSAGKVKCWGLNYFGQLGTAPNEAPRVPVEVSGFGNPVSAVATGEHHSCALTSSGSVWCWGRNDSGQLGNNTKDMKHSPTQVTGLSSAVVALAAGCGHTCAVTSSGGLLCWGANYRGQVGDNGSTDRKTPTQVSGLTSGVVAVSAGCDHTCAVTGGGEVLCWGRNAVGELGIGETSEPRRTPTQVSGATSGFVSVASGWRHSCALKSSGQLLCWGRNNGGSLGDGTTVDSLIPRQVGSREYLGLSVPSAGEHTCAITSSGGLECWGVNKAGQLGEGTKGKQTRPTQVSGLTSGVVEVAAGKMHTCALLHGGDVRCWGNNHYRQFGNGTTTDSLVPTPVLGIQ